MTEKRGKLTGIENVCLGLETDMLWHEGGARSDFLLPGSTSSRKRSRGPLRHHAETLSARTTVSYRFFVNFYYVGAQSIFTILIFIQIKNKDRGDVDARGL